MFYLDWGGVKPIVCRYCPKIQLDEGNEWLRKEQSASLWSTHTHAHTHTNAHTYNKNQAWNDKRLAVK